MLRNELIWRRSGDWHTEFILDNWFLYDLLMLVIGPVHYILSTNKLLFRSPYIREHSYFCYFFISDQTNKRNESTSRVETSVYCTEQITKLTVNIHRESTEF